MKPSFQNMCAMLRKSEPFLTDTECIERCKEFGISVDIPKDESFTLASFNSTDYILTNHNGECQYEAYWQVVVSKAQLEALQKLAPEALVTAIRSNVKAPRKSKQDTAQNKTVIE